ncbi:MAG TPA: thioredoxin family protein [Myxococcaceae bacterium]|nr:thioredoxin family protein [Myxococcaceae bacterium]
MATVNLDASGFRPALAKPGILLIDFWAKWCAPCRFFGPVFERVSARHPDVTFAKVDVDEQEELSGMLGVQAMPTLMVFRDGVLLLNHAGALPESALEDLLRQARALDMGEVRRKMEEYQAEKAAEGRVRQGA